MRWTFQVTLYSVNILHLNLLQISAWGWLRTEFFLFVCFCFKYFTKCFGWKDFNKDDTFSTTSWNEHDIMFSSWLKVVVNLSCRALQFLRALSRCSHTKHLQAAFLNIFVSSVSPCIITFFSVCCRLCLQCSLPSYPFFFFSFLRWSLAVSPRL